MLANIATAILRATHPARLATWKKILPLINGYQSEISQLSEADVRKRSLSLRYRAKSQEPLDRLLPEAYALVREAARRSLGMCHFDVQLLGGIALHNQSVIEMQT